MVRKVTSKPVIKFHFQAQAESPLVSYLIEVNAKGKELSSQADFAPCEIWPTDVYLRLVDVSERSRSADEALTELAAKRPTNLPQSEFNSLPLAELLVRLAAIKDFPAQYASVNEKSLSLRRELYSVGTELATSHRFMEQICAKAIPLQVSKTDDDDRGYALYRGSVWTCLRSLEADQWRVLIDRFIDREESELAATLAIENDFSHSRERIPSETRRAVWLRDKGMCAKCTSRDRLEFDHIIPISRGGSNTARNIELLCEICNRLKSNAIM